MCIVLGLDADLSGLECELDRGFKGEVLVTLYILQKLYHQRKATVKYDNMLIIVTHNRKPSAAICCQLTERTILSGAGCAIQRGLHLDRQYLKKQKKKKEKTAAGMMLHSGLPTLQFFSALF
jgi:hypothetical protein